MPEKPRMPVKKNPLLQLFHDATGVKPRHLRQIRPQAWSRVLKTKKARCSRPVQKLNALSAFRKASPRHGQNPKALKARKTIAGG